MGFFLQPVATCNNALWQKNWPISKEEQKKGRGGGGGGEMCIKTTFLIFSKKI